MILNRKINSNKTKHELVKNELKKLQTFYTSYFRAKNHFENNGTQEDLVFQSMNNYFKKVSNTDHISEWKYKGLSDKVIKTLTTTDNSLALALSYVGNKIEFDGTCLKQDNITYNRWKTVNIYVVYKLISTLD